MSSDLELSWNLYIFSNQNLVNMVIVINISNQILFLQNLEMNLLYTTSAIRLYVYEHWELVYPKFIKI